MIKVIRGCGVLAVCALLATGTGIAQSSGEDIFREKCVNCHGTAGLANSGVGRLMKVKPVTDPEVAKLTEAEMIDAVLNGKGKMQPYKNSLTDAQVRVVVEYFRTLIK